MERTFGVLQAPFAIFRGLARNIDKVEFGMIMNVCVILHNMIADEERDSYDLAFVYNNVEDNTRQPNVRRDYHLCYAVCLHRVAEVHDPELHAHLHSPIRPY